jgi:hypothetical protein
MLDQRVRVTPSAATDLSADYLWDYMEWLTVQNGGAPPRPQVVGTTRRYIITSRDLSEWLHRDFSHQGGTDAVFILMANGVGFAAGNPYVTSQTQVGNFTFGVSQILDLIASTANNALQACWFHKWAVDRKVRPEEFGGSIHNKLTFGLPRPIHRDVLDSVGLARSRAKYGTALLPQAYAEGCPTHPAYPSGHSTFAGAWGTILKAFFNTEAVITNPVVPDAAGSALVPYAGPPLTAGNEIDKLVSNVGPGRAGACGVHWRSDCDQGMYLGEACAIAVLQDMRRTWNESFVGFQFRKYDGTMVTI